MNFVTLLKGDKSMVLLCSGSPFEDGLVDAIRAAVSTPELIAVGCEVACAARRATSEREGPIFDLDVLVHLRQAIREFGNAVRVYRYQTEKPPAVAPVADPISL